MITGQSTGHEARNLVAAEVKGLTGSDLNYDLRFKSVHILIVSIQIKDVVAGEIGIIIMGSL